jgi:hypothetical protein
MPRRAVLEQKGLWGMRYSDSLGLFSEPTARSSSTAPANYFVLLNWACTIYVALFKECQTVEVSDTLCSLVRILASVFNALLHKATHVKPAMQRGAIVRMRRTVRVVWCTISRVGILICNCPSESKDNSISHISATFSSPASHYRTISGIDYRCSSSSQTSARTVSFMFQRCGWLSKGYSYSFIHVIILLIISTQRDILNFYCNQLLMAKTPVPHHASVSMSFEELFATY